jgi:hypothetical protein
MRAIILLGAILTVAGCAAERAVLVNNQGDELACETSGAGLFGAASVHYEQQHCITDAEKRGYRLKN